MRRAAQDPPSVLGPVPSAYEGGLPGAMSRAGQHLTKLREASAPVEKLDAFLHTVRTVLASSRKPEHALTVEQFTCLLAAVLVAHDCSWIEMERYTLQYFTSSCHASSYSIPHMACIRTWRIPLTCKAVNNVFLSAR